MSNNYAAEKIREEIEELTLSLDGYTADYVDTEEELCRLANKIGETNRKLDSLMTAQRKISNT